MPVGHLSLTWHLLSGVSLRHHHVKATGPTVPITRISLGDARHPVLGRVMHFGILAFVFCLMVSCMLKYKFYKAMAFVYFVHSCEIRAIIVPQVW